MCSSGGEIAKSDEALQKSQAAFTDILSKDYQLAFGQQALVLKQQQARLNNMIANPLGYTPTQLHLAKTAINDTTATAAKQAIGSAAAFAAAHGGAADIAGGPAAMLAGQIAEGATSTKAKMLADLAQTNEGAKRQNFLSAIEGMSAVGSGFGSQSGTALGSEASVANSSVSAGQGAQEAKNAGWEHFGSTLSGIAGLGKAASGFQMPKF